MALEIIFPMAWSLDFSVLDVAIHQVAWWLEQILNLLLPQAP